MTEQRFQLVADISSDDPAAIEPPFTSYGVTEQSTRRYGDAPPGYVQHRRGHGPCRHRDLRANHQPPWLQAARAPKATVRRNSPAYRPGLRFRVEAMTRSGIHRPAPSGFCFSGRPWSGCACFRQLVRGRPQAVRACGVAQIQASGEPVLARWGLLASCSSSPAFAAARGRTRTHRTWGLCSWAEKYARHRCSSCL
jgi:hypothetical protein